MDVTPFAEGLSLVKQLRPITFRWKTDGAWDVGLGAEQVNKVAPLLVTRNAHGEVEGVKYDRINVALINAIQQQQSQIDVLQQQVQDLRKIVCLRRPSAKACK
jgi:hypothetical protein